MKPSLFLLKKPVLTKVGNNIRWGQFPPPQYLMMYYYKVALLLEYYKVHFETVNVSLLFKGCR